MEEFTGITAERSESHRGDAEKLVGLFYPNLESLGTFTSIGTDELPTSYAALLAHEDHMTVTLEAYHETLVTLSVVKQTVEHEWYGRQSLLARQSDGAVVQYGIVRLETSGLPWEVRDAIHQHRAPLGRVLIRNNLLRHVELLALWRITPSPELSGPLALDLAEMVYGRSAAIHIAGRLAVEVLEIVTDHPRALHQHQTT